MTEEFIPLKQTNNWSCTQCTIAMFKKIPLEYVTNNTTQKGQIWKDVYNMFWYFGLPIYCDKIKGVPPSDGKWYIIRLKFSWQHKGHLAGFKDGFVYCSNRGKYLYTKERGTSIDFHVGFLNQP